MSQIRVGVYYRVSTDKQDIAMQEHAVGQWLAAKFPDAVVTEYRDEGFSGMSAKRPAYNRLCDDVKAGSLDAVVTYRLDRLSRDAITALRILMDWIQAGVSFYATDQAILSLGKDNPMRLSLVAIFAEIAALEREVIVSRVKAGLAAARARGVRLGAASKLSPAQQQQARALRQQGLTFARIGHRLGVSTNTVRKVCREVEHAQTQSG